MQFSTPEAGSQIRLNFGHIPALTSPFTCAVKSCSWLPRQLVLASGNFLKWSRLCCFEGWPNALSHLAGLRGRLNVKTRMSQGGIFFPTVRLTDIRQTQTPDPNDSRSFLQCVVWIYHAFRRLIPAIEHCLPIVIQLNEFTSDQQDKPPWIMQSIMFFTE